MWGMMEIVHVTMCVGDDDVNDVTSSMSVVMYSLMKSDESVFRYTSSAKRGNTTCQGRQSDTSKNRTVCTFRPYCCAASRKGMWLEPWTDLLVYLLSLFIEA